MKKTMTITKNLKLGLCGIGLLSQMASAELLNIKAEVDFPNAPPGMGGSGSGSSASGIVESYSYSTYDDVRKAIDNLGQPNSNFYQVFNAYDALSNGVVMPGFDPQASVNANVLGANMSLTAALGDPALHLTSSDLNLNQSFNGQTRAQSLHMLADWAKNNASDLIKRANSTTPLNPVIGTPFAAANIMDTHNFSLTDNTGGSTAADGTTENKISLAARFSNYTFNNKDVNVITLPVGYTLNFKKGYALILSLPLTYADIAGTPSYSVSFGTGLKLPVSNWFSMQHSWSLTPIVRVGAVGSDKNLASASTIYSGGLLSEYDLPLADGILGFKNMYSYYVTTSVSQYLNLKIDDVKLNVPDITNSIFKNGIYYSRYLGPQFWGRKLSGTVFFTDTRYTGTVLYTDNQQEVGFNFGLAPNSSQANSTGSFLRRQLDAQDLRFGVSYTSAKAIEGFSANFGFSF